MKYILLIVLVIVLIFLQKKIENFKSKKDKLIIIIPLRDRELHLKKFLRNMIPILKHQKITYKIYIIEQNEGKKFNKGMINNVGFKIVEKENKNFKNILFNDVDNFPLDKDTINYNIDVKGFHHFFGNPRWLGGFYMTTKSHFKKINGYSNDFWGWGGEDNDLQNRIKAMNIDIIRDQFFKRFEQDKIYDPDHERNRKFDFREKLKDKGNKYKEDKKNVYKDGLNTCKYKILKKKKLENNIYRYLIDI